MLSINQVVAACNEAVFVRFGRKCSARIKGEYDPQALEISIYPKNNTSRSDLDITLLHEFIHARDDVKSARSVDSAEKDVEKEAKQTYRLHPYVLRFIKELYNIKY